MWLRSRVMGVWIKGFPRRTSFVWDPAEGSPAQVYASLLEQGWELDYGSPPEGVWAFVNGRDRLAWAMRETDTTRVARESAERDRSESMRQAALARGLDNAGGLVDDDLGQNFERDEQGAGSV